MRSRDRRPDRPVFERDVREDMDDELAFHLEERVRYYLERGLDEADARRAASERLGDLDAVRAACRDLARSERRVSALRRWLGDLRGDVLFGVRSAARAPVLTLMAVATLALGTGANAAVFNVVRSVLLDSLPYRDDGRLVRVYDRAVDDPGERSDFSSGAVVDYEERQRSFERLAAYRPTVWDAVYRPDGAARVVGAAFVEAGFFETLGVQPALGRFFTHEETLDNVFVVVLSHDMWQREFGADSAVIGRSVHMDSDTREIIGVLPADFIGPMGRADLWLGFEPRRSLIAGSSGRQSRWLGLIGRLRSGVTPEMARRELAAIADDLARDHPASDADRTVAVVTLRDSLVGDTRTALLALMGSAALVLLIACANLAGALLARTLGRRQEFAIRVAIGAGRGRLLRQLFTESMLLAIAGAGSGLIVAVALLGGLRRFAPAALPAWTDLSLDGSAIGLMTLAAIATGLLIGISPALAARDTNTGQALRAGARGSGGSRSGHLRGLLVAAQVALCLTLLAAASLLSRSLLAMTMTSPGYDSDNVLTVAVKGPIPTSDDARRQFFDQLEMRVESLPGVLAVATTSELPGPVMTSSDVTVESSSGRSDAPVAVPAATVSDDYFRTMRIPVVEGREFGPQDRSDATPAVIVSESMARRFWPAGGAVGARLRMGPDTRSPMAIVVGVAGDVRNDVTMEAFQPMLYTTSRQSLLRGVRTYIVRTAGDPAELVQPFARELESLDRSVPMSTVTTLRDRSDAQTRRRALPAVMLAAFAALALVLASVGVYALFAAFAAAREREFGIRITLGSTPFEIAGLVLRQGAFWMLAGLGAGVIGALVSAHALRSLLFRVTPLDPASMSLALGVLAVSGAVALLVPITRVFRLDPTSILR